MIEETYKFKWKTFEEELPVDHKMILARSPKKPMKEADWFFIDTRGKTLWIHDLKYSYYISKIKKWLWCYADDITLVQEAQNEG